jgi:hypothetical protein
MLLGTPEKAEITQERQRSKASRKTKKKTKPGQNFEKIPITGKNKAEMMVDRPVSNDGV